MHLPARYAPRRPAAFLLTALSLECKAVTEFLSDPVQRASPDGTVYDFGVFEDWEVAVAEAGPGNVSAALHVERVMHILDPKCVVFVGVAGGLKDVELGDVVAASKVYGYESGKEISPFNPRPELFRSTYRLEQCARAIVRSGSWLQRVRDGREPEAFVAPIAAGEKVVVSQQSRTIHLVRTVYSDTLAIEMEGKGFLEGAFAHRCEATVIRGISDLLDNKADADKQGWQRIAAHHAAAFAFELLSSWSRRPVVSFLTLRRGPADMTDDWMDDIERRLEEIERLLRERGTGMSDERGIKVVGARRGPDGEVVLEIESTYAAFHRLQSAHEDGVLSGALGEEVLSMQLAEDEAGPAPVGTTRHR